MMVGDTIKVDSVSYQKYSNHARFKEFFSEHYKENMQKILDVYPDKRSLILNYIDLEMFDPNLADLLIEKPEEVIAAAEDIILSNNEIDVNIRFENVNNIHQLKSLESHNIGNFIVIEGRLTKIDEPAPRIKTGVFECRGCMRLHEVEQSSGSRIIEPSLCSECGGRSFRLLQEESEYIGTQTFEIGYIYEKDKTTRKLLCVIEDDLVSYDDYNIGQPIKLTGILKTFREGKSGKFKEYLYVNNIEFLDYPIECDEEDSSEREYGDRNSPEYREWRQKVINRDKGVCQCCGSTKNPHAHHIYGYINYPDLRVDVNNGITLCKWCHRRYHDDHGIKNTNPIDLMNFFNRYGNSSTVIIKEYNSPDFKIVESDSFNGSYKSKSRVRELHARRYLCNNNYNSLLKIIDSLSDEEGLCSYESLISELSPILNSNEIEEIISGAKRIGQIYEPISNHLKIVIPEEINREGDVL